MVRADDDEDERLDDLVRASLDAMDPKSLHPSGSLYR